MKKVVKKQVVEVVDVDKVSVDKIYVTKMGEKRVYKAHCVCESADKKWAFISLKSSEFYANGTEKTLFNLINKTISNGDEVYEFDTVKEFLEWSLQNI